MSIPEKYKKNIPYKIFNQIRLIYFKILVIFQLLFGKHQLFLKGIKTIKSKGLKELTKKIFEVQSDEFINKSINDQYKLKVKQNKLSLSELKKQSLKKFKLNPLISIIVPVYNPNEEFLVECIESVLKQTYPNWELCIADDCSTNPKIKRILNKFQQKDNRIKLTFRQKNGHICNASNSALKLATGKYIALLDNDDFLPPNAIYEIIKTINKLPNTDYIYSDEDKFKNKIGFNEPSFKPSWSLDKLFGYMYTGHLSVYRKEIIDKVKGFTPGTHGAQDYDLLLKSLPYIKKIRHIPKILYHWRQHQNSTSTNLKCKPYALDAGKNVLFNRLTKYINKPFNVINMENGYYYLDFCPLENKKIDLYIKKNTNNEKIINFLKTKINQLVYYKNIEDLNSLINKGNGEYSLIINQSVDVSNPDSLNNFLRYLDVNNVGMIGPKIINKKNQIISSGLIVLDKIETLFLNKNVKYGYTNNISVQSNVSGLSSTFFAFKTKTFKEKIKYFDKNLDSLFAFDMSIRLNKYNLRTVFYPQLSIINYSNKEAVINKEYVLLKIKYKNQLKEKFLNRNLTINNKNNLCLKNIFNSF